MPPLAHPVVDYGHLYGLQGLGAQPGAGAKGAPSRRYTDFAEESLAARRKAYGGDMGELLSGTVQAEDGDIEAVRLRGEFEVRVDLEEEVVCRYKRL